LFKLFTKCPTDGCRKDLIKVSTVNLSLSLTKYHAMKMNGRLRYYKPMAFLTPELEWSGWSASSLHPEERELGTQWIGGCVGPRIGLKAVAK
jgi:hypothetical protein